MHIYVHYTDVKKNFRKVYVQCLNFYTTFALQWQLNALGWAVSYDRKALDLWDSIFSVPTILQDQAYKCAKHFFSENIAHILLLVWLRHFTSYILTLQISYESTKYAHNLFYLYLIFFASRRCFVMSYYSDKLEAR